MKGTCLRDCFDGTGKTRYLAYSEYDIDPDSPEARYFDFDNSSRPTSADPRELNYRRTQGGCGAVTKPTNK